MSHVKIHSFGAGRAAAAAAAAGSRRAGISTSSPTRPAGCRRCPWPVELAGWDQHQAKGSGSSGAGQDLDGQGLGVIRCRGHPAAAAGSRRAGAGQDLDQLADVAGWVPAVPVVFEVPALVGGRSAPGEGLGGVRQGLGVAGGGHIQQLQRVRAGRRWPGSRPARRRGRLGAGGGAGGARGRSAPGRRARGRPVPGSSSGGSGIEAGRDLDQLADVAGWVPVGCRRCPWCSRCRRWRVADQHQAEGCGVVRCRAHPAAAAGEGWPALARISTSSPTWPAGCRRGVDGARGVRGAGAGRRPISTRPKGSESSGRASFF